MAQTPVEPQFPKRISNSRTECSPQTLEYLPSRRRQSAVTSLVPQSRFSAKYTGSGRIVATWM
jgi:hypothetical protein